MFEGQRRPSGRQFAPLILSIFPQISDLWGREINEMIVQ